MHVIVCACAFLCKIYTSLEHVHVHNDTHMRVLSVKQNKSMLHIHIAPVHANICVLGQPFQELVLNGLGLHGIKKRKKAILTHIVTNWAGMCVQRSNYSPCGASMVTMYRDQGITLTSLALSLSPVLVSSY